MAHLQIMNRAPSWHWSMLNHLLTSEEWGDDVIFNLVKWSTAEILTFKSKNDTVPAAGQSVFYWRVILAQRLCYNSRQTRKLYISNHGESYMWQDICDPLQQSDFVVLLLLMNNHLNKKQVLMWFFDGFFFIVGVGGVASCSHSILIFPVGIF